MKLVKHIIAAKTQYVLAGMTIVAILGIATVASAVATSTDSTAATSSDSVVASSTAITTPVDTGTTTTTSATANASTTVTAATSTSTAPTGSVATSSPANVPTGAATSTAQTNSVATIPPTSVTTPIAPPVVPPTSQGFTLVHANGTVYTDYFTNGKKTVSFPGDPDVDGNLDKPNAPMPVHAGLTWVKTTGSTQYDTPSRNLEVGDYLQQADGSFVVHLPSSTYTGATSTNAVPDHIVVTNADPTK